MRPPFKTIFVAVIILAVVALAYFLRFNTIQPSVTTQTLKGYFGRDMPGSKQEQLLAEFESISSSDTGRVNAFVREKRKELRSLLPDLETRFLFETVTKSRDSLSLAPEELERLAVLFDQQLAEPVHFYRKQCYANLSDREKWLELDAEYLMARGDSLRRKEDFSQARDHFEQALKRFKSTDDLAGAAHAYYLIGYTQYRLGNRIEAIADLSRSIDLAQRVGDPPLRLQALIMKGVVSSRMNNYAASEGLLLEALDLARQLSDKISEARINSNLATVCQETGRLLESLKLSKSSLRVYEELDIPIQKVTTLRRLAFTYESLGDYAKALACHEAGLKICQELNRPLLLVNELNNLGGYYNLLNDYEHALYYFKQAYEIVKKLGNQRIKEAILFANIGDNYAKLDSSGLAYNYLNKALEYTASPEYADLQADIYQLIGEANLQENAWSKAIDAFSRALDTNSEKGNILGGIRNHIGLGQAYYQSQNWQEAQTHFERALEQANEVGSPLYTWKAQYGKGLVLKARGEVDDALAQFRTAIAAIETSRGRIKEERTRIGYFADKQDVFDEMIRTWLEEKKDAREALGYLERARARSFLDLFQGRVEIISESNFVETGSSGLELVLSGAMETPEIAKIQASLGPKDRIIEYRVFSDLLTIWCLDRDHLETVDVSVSRDTIRNLVQSFRVQLGADSTEAFQNKTAAELRNSYKNLTALAQKLSSILIQPVRYQFDASMNLYIIPDDILHYLPFAALTLPEDSTKYLIEAVSYATLPSASILYYELLKKQAGMDGQSFRILSVVDPAGDLPGARATGTAMKKQFPQCELLLGQQANKNALYHTLADTFDIVHFGTHVSVNNASPLYSAIHLAPTDVSSTPAPRVASNPRSSPEEASAQDENLRMYEVFALPLTHTRLVVLPGCETALGRFDRGEGLVSLARAFMYAGTPTIVTTLWQVDDQATARVMQDFYGVLYSAQSNVSQALRAAQLKEIEHLRRHHWLKQAHPFFWAPFVVVGRVD